MLHICPHKLPAYDAADNFNEIRASLVPGWGL